MLTPKTSKICKEVLIIMYDHELDSQINTEASTASPVPQARWKPKIGKSGFSPYGIREYPMTPEPTRVRLQAQSLLIERDPEMPTCFGIVPLASGIQLLVIGYIMRQLCYAV